MAKVRVSLIAAVTAAGMLLTACGSNDSSTSAANSSSAAADSTAGTITVEDNYGEQTVPSPPKATASTDNRTFEVLQEWGVDLVAAPKPIIPASLSDYKNDEGIADLGTHREPDLEQLVAAQPDLIISGQRFSQHYEDMKKLNPDTAIVDFEPREDKPVDEELKRQVTDLGKIYQKETEAQKLVEDFDKALERAKKAYKDSGEKTITAVNVSGGEIGYVAPTVGRFYGPIFDWLEMKPALKVEGATSNHEGDDVSVETIAQANPGFLLVLDRDAGTSARNEAGYTAAEKVLKDNAALQNTDVIKENKLYVAPEDTYTNESIITYTEVLNAIADAFENAK